MKKKFLLSAIVTVLMIICMLPAISLAGKGPMPVGNLAYITFYNDKDMKTIFNQTASKFDKISGVSYDKSKNTLTLKNVKTTMNIETNVMGDDFKINVVGYNEIGRLSIWGDSYGGNVTITGNGELVINKKKANPCAVLMSAELTNGNFIVDKNVKLKMYAKKGNGVLATYGSTNSNKNKAIQFKGKLDTKVTIKSKKDEYVQASYIEAYDLENEFQYEQFTKSGDSKMYLGNKNYDSKTYEPDGTYRMYEAVYVKEIGKYFLKKAISGLEKCVPAQKGFTSTGKDQKAVDNWPYHYALYKDAKGNEYGLQNVVYNGVEKKKLYKITTVNSIGKFAECINEDLKSLNGYTQQIDFKKNIYSYEIKEDTLEHNTANYPKTVKLSDTKYTYNGKVKKPSVIIKDKKGKKVSSSNYTVSYEKGRKNVGKYCVTIKFKGKYKGTKKLYFEIKPKETSISKISAKKKGFKVKYKKQTKQTTGYQIEYSTNSKFKKSSKYTVSKNRSTSYTAKKLSAKKKYYVRVRTYKKVKVDGKYTNIYSGWSKVKTVKTKK